MNRQYLSRECSPKSKGLNFERDLSNEESDDSDFENYESDAEYLEDYIVTQESKHKGLGLMAIKTLKKGSILGIMRGYVIKSKSLLKFLILLFILLIFM